MSYIKKVKSAATIYFKQHPTYYRYYKKLGIEKNTVLIESFHGKDIVGHLYYVMQALIGNNSRLTIYLAAQNPQKIRAFLLMKNIRGVRVVKHLSRDYLRLLASAEYLLNDVTFYDFFIKKSGQKYINFWHGTPLKTLGTHMDEITAGANAQRNFYMANKIIVNNEFTSKVLADSHGLNGIYQGKMVVGPSPRNSVLLNKQKREEVRQQLKLEHKKIVFYMPTWRGTLSNVADDSQKILTDLRYLSGQLKDDECFFVKFHHLQTGIDLSEFHNIFLMPDEYELYEFLTAVDILVTDYSSVMYDFVLANRKIILYTYDKEVYFSTRGVYDCIDRYPFVKVDHVHDLLTEIQKQEDVDYSEMINEFCPVDVENGTQIICDYIFKEQSHELIQESTLLNEKKTAFILGGGFWDNGVTTSLLNTFDNIDLDKRNYVVLLGQKQLKKEYEFRVRNLSKKIIFYPFPEQLVAGALDRFLYLAYIKFEWFDGKWIRKRVAAIVKDDYHRIVGGLKVNHVVHFTGFGNRYAELIKHVPNKVNTVMYVHTDMMAEYKAKRNFSKKIIFSAYEQVDKLAVVHENLKEGLITEIPAVCDKLYVMDNFLGECRIRTLAEADLLETLVEVQMEHGDKEKLISDLQAGDVSIFINIGRFDYQKGHDRLITAFEAVYKDNMNSRLVIVAPHGPLREKTLELVKSSSANSSIYILGRMSNPYALLAQCDCFVLSSHYEGLGLVVYEALAVGTSVVTVDLKETIEYLQNNEAIIVMNSIIGLEKGMCEYLSGKCIINEFDFSVQKGKSKLAFEQLF